MGWAKRVVLGVLVLAGTACSDDSASTPDRGVDRGLSDVGARDGHTVDALETADQAVVDSAIAGFTIESTAFGGGNPIPERYTCSGNDVSPALSWRDAPAGTKSFALIVDDPDAGFTFVHWVIFDIPASATGLAEDVGGVGTEGVNDFGNNGYGGPCPPSGVHRYFFKLYALSVSSVGLSAGATKDALLTAMQGKIVGQAELLGTVDSGVP